MKIFLLGFMGSGKSYWGRELASLLEMPLTDLDHEIEEKSGLTIPQIFASKGESHFRDLERDALLEMLKHDHYVLSCGGGLPCFFDNMELMNHHGLTIWLDAPLPVMIERLKKDKDKRPLLQAMDDAEMALFVGKKMAERRIFYEQAKWTISTEEYTPESLAKKITSCINHF